MIRRDHPPVDAAPAAAIEAIERLFASAGATAYLGEDVTIADHQLQAGALALREGCEQAIAVAALVHDVGHMVRHRSDDRVDADHDRIGADWLAEWFGPDVTEPVRLHVAAKRYLVATEVDYAAMLSPASVDTLALQGGPMSPTERAAFEARPYAAAAVILRRLDDAAKDPAIVAPQIGDHRDLLRRVLTRQRRAAGSTPRVRRT
jgi:gamma-butyrobetaine dioxygenase